MDSMLTCGSILSNSLILADTVINVSSKLTRSLTRQLFLIGIVPHCIPTNSLILFSALRAELLARAKSRLQVTLSRS